MIRKLSYTLDATGGITPDQPVFAGFCTEHNATTLTFSLDSALRQTLSEKSLGSTLYYRFEVTDGMNRHFVLEPEALGDKTNIDFTLSNAFTQTSGCVTVSLVFEIPAGENLPLVLYAFPARLKLKENGKASTDTPPISQTIVTALDSAVRKADDMAELCEEMEASLASGQQILNAITAKAEAVESASESAAATMAQCELMETSAENNANSAAGSAQEAAAKAELAAQSATAAQAAEASINALLTAKADVSYVDQVTGSLSDSVSGQIEQHTQILATLGESVSNKADIGYVANEISTLGNSLGPTLMETVSDVESLQETVSTLASKSYVDQKAEELAQQIPNTSTPSSYALLGQMTAQDSDSCFGVNASVLENCRGFIVQITLPDTFSGGLNDIGITVNQSALVALIAPGDTPRTLQIICEKMAGTIWKTQVLQYLTSGSEGTVIKTLLNLSSVGLIFITCNEGQNFPKGMTIDVYIA